MILFFVGFLVQQLSCDFLKVFYTPEPFPFLSLTTIFSIRTVFISMIMYVCKLCIWLHHMREPEVVELQKFNDWCKIYCFTHLDTEWNCIFFNLLLLSCIVTCSSASNNGQFSTCHIISIWLGPVDFVVVARHYHWQRCCDDNIECFGINAATVYDRISFPVTWLSTTCFHYVFY